MLYTSMARSTPTDRLLERIDKGALQKFKIGIKTSEHDFFEFDYEGDKIVGRGNTRVNIASGLSHYLKNYVGVHLSWNQMTVKLPAR